jgi:hypothetical protein
MKRVKKLISKHTHSGLMHDPELKSPSMLATALKGHSSAPPSLAVRMLSTALHLDTCQVPTSALSGACWTEVSALACMMVMHPLPRHISTPWHVGHAHKQKTRREGAPSAGAFPAPARRTLYSVRCRPCSQTKDQAGGGPVCGGVPRTRSAHCSVYWLSAMRHCSPNMVTYSHHFHGTLLALASWNTHSCRRFSCGTQRHPEAPFSASCKWEAAAQPTCFQLISRLPCQE